MVPCRGPFEEENPSAINRPGQDIIRSTEATVGRKPGNKISSERLKHSTWRESRTQIQKWSPVKSCDDVVCREVGSIESRRK